VVTSLVGSRGPAIDSTSRASCRGKRPSSIKSSRGSIRNSRGDAPLLLESVRQRRQVCHRDLAVLARARALGRSWKLRQVVLVTKCPSDFPRPPSSIRRHPHGRAEAWRRPTHRTSLTAQSPSSRREFVSQTTWTSASASRKSRSTQR
jgi:hypothetical protein